MHEYMDGALPHSAEVAIKQHLKSCQNCSEAFEKEARFSRVFKDAMEHRTSSISVDLSMVNNLKEAEKRQEFKSLTKKGLKLVLKPVSVVLASLFIILVVLVLHMSNPSKKDSTFAYEEPGILEPFESLLIEDPKTDWIERRLIITIVDEEQKTVEKFITSKFPDRIIRFREKLEVRE